MNVNEGKKAKVVKVFPGLVILEVVGEGKNVLAEPKGGKSYQLNQVFILSEPYKIGQSEYYQLENVEVNNKDEITAIERLYFFKNNHEIETFINFYYFQYHSLVTNLIKHYDIEIDDLPHIIDNLFELFKTLKSALIENDKCTEIEIIDTAKYIIGEDFDEIASFRNYFDEIEDLITTDFLKVHDKVDLAWNSWRGSEEQTFFSGYNDENFIISRIEKNSILQQHYYRSPPSNIVVDCIEINQKGFTFYLTKMEVRMIAQTSTVPSLNSEITVLDAATRILDNSYKIDEWQRQADLKRISRIHSFIDDSNNVIANSPMLFVKDENAVKFIGNKLVIDFKSFLKVEDHEEHGEVYTDFSSYDAQGDLKPMWLIDGQHRVLGIHRSERFNKIEIPVIVFPNNFSISKTAKVFAEINTFQVKLSPLHEIYMQHRFKLGHVKNNRRFNDVWNCSLENAIENHWKKDWEDSRANHFSYEICAHLATRDTLINRIQILAENVDVKIRVINAEQFINYTRKYFLTYPYDFRSEKVFMALRGIKNMRDMVPIYFAEIGAYLGAFATLYNEENWADNKSRWFPNSGHKRPLIVKETFFQILLELYPLVNRLARVYQLSKNPSSGDLCLELKDFYHVLKPIKNVDWLDNKINDVFKGGGERQRRCIEVWLSDALQNCMMVPSVDDVLDETRQSEAGCGITASLKPPVVEYLHERGIMNNAGDIDFKVLRPLNARYEGKYYLYSNDVEFKSGTIKHEKDLRKSVKRVFVGQREFNDKRNLKIAVQYTNISNVMSGRYEENL